MMKKTIKAVFVAIFVLSIAILTLGSCDSNAPDAASGEKECNHQWGEWETITEANCVNPGIAKRECSLCKENEEKDISATGQHKESNWIVDKEPTYHETGAKHTECTVCRITINVSDIDKIIDEHDHQYESYNCTICGLTSEECFEFTYLEETDSYEIKAKAGIDLPSEIVLPGTYNDKAVTSIGYEAFLGCIALSSITIPGTVTTIGGGAFLGCTSLSTIAIPLSVTTIGWHAFEGCTSLKTVIFAQTKGWWCSSSTKYRRRTGTRCHLPRGCRRRSKCRR